MSFVYTVGLGDTLRAHRAATGMTRKDQSRQFDLSYLTLLAWERKPVIRAQQNNVKMVLRKLCHLSYYAKARVKVFKTQPEAVQESKQKQKEGKAGKAKTARPKNRAKK